ncbi:hypothetical protein QNI19_38830 [Cytophagaceae bacterium DM2B3-1]|uniref:Sigma-70 family RNA polymerase sigma factor n=1 Tax=Xanthocytophaga flava TaxID=3048013 RepID=A0ABT7CYU2_9BACT|nr:hypothetical protein [Xanthocytophaga flavus]MDJ1498946.1 hypothetical protein [Xanthocytophaga flavus]
MNWEELKDESTSDLIGYVKSIRDDSYKELAEAAFVTLTFRFRKDIIDKCNILMRKWKRSEDDAYELANRVFARFFKYPAFDNSKCQREDINLCFRIYLYGIANREILRMLYPAYSPYDGNEHIVTSLINPETDYEPERLKKLSEMEKRLDEIFEKLTPKHKIIFLTYKTYEMEGKTLPRPLLTELRDILGLSQNSIRVYKKEASDLVKKELNK